MEPASPQAEAKHLAPSSRFTVRALFNLVGQLFPRSDRLEAAVTTVRFDAPPEAVWRGMLFYEEVPRRPLLFLRLFLPRPLRTSGEKTIVGSIIRCEYDGGSLVKRITRADAPHRVEFDVLEQRLGVEGCVSMGHGSYDIAGVDGGSDVVLTTNYRGHLRPRWLLRPLERYLAHAVHRHILAGMREVLAAAPKSLPALADPICADVAQPPH